MAGGLDSLSADEFRQLSNTINEAKKLLAAQEELLQRTLQMEQQIVEHRIAGLKDYNAEYAKFLKAIASEQASLRDEMSQINQAAKEAADAANKTAKAKNEAQSGKTAEKTSDSNVKKRKADSPIAGNTITSEDKEEADTPKLEDKDDKKFADKAAALFRYNQEERRIITETNDQERDALLNIDELRALQSTKQQEHYKNNLNLVQQNMQALSELELARYRDETDRELSLTELRLSKIKEVTQAELAAQNAINDFETELAWASTPEGASEAGELRARELSAKAEHEIIKKLAEDRAAYIAKRELELTRKNNGVLTKEDAAKIQKEAATKFKLDKDNVKKLAAAQREAEANKAMEQEVTAGLGVLVDKKASFSDKKQALYDLTHDEAGNLDKQKAGAAAVKAVEAGLKAISDLAQQLESTIDEIAQHKGVVDTRLQGSNNEKFMGSYWDQLVRDMTSVGAVNPYFKQADFAKNIETLVSQGISFDLKQRAFLMTVQNKIASTFEVTNDTLLRLVRIQQEDSTAGRLGMESALNAFLNEMYETSEYLSGVAKSVRSSLEEMEALMSGAAATEVEYQVQKWLGSLYSVGMSQEAVTSISNALGQIAAGQIEGLTNGGSGNLLIMAANDAGIPIADILTRGITADETNTLLQAAVNYLAELAKSSEDNKVVQQQLAGVFGVKASDLKAATNLVLPGTTTTIYKNSKSYGDMISRLYEMADSMGSRTSIAEMMTNIWENGQYTLAGSMASNPISYFIYKMAKVVDSAAGGIDLPFVNVMGFGVDLNTTVSDLMRVAAVGAGILGSLAPMVEGLSSSFSGRAMLESLGIKADSNLAITPRGIGGETSSTGGGQQTTSGSGYIGNASGSDVKDSTIQEAEDSKKQQMIEAKEEAEASQIDFINTNVLKIYELLSDVTTGNASFRVQLEGYGLTKAGNSSNGGAQGGVQGLTNNTSSGGFGGGSGSTGSSTGSTGSGGVSGGLDFGGWTTA